MRDLFIVAKFTIKDMVKRKSFIISNLIILGIIVLLFNVPNLLNLINGDNTTTGEEYSTNILIVDTENIFEGTLEQINNMELGYNVQVSNTEVPFEEIKQKIENSEIDDAVVVTENNGQINLEYIVESLAMITEMPEQLVNAITTVYSNLQISKLGLTAEQIQRLTPNFNFEMKQTSEEEVQGNQFAMMLMSLVLFYAIYFCAYQVSSSITTEKTSKIMETLVTSTSPRTIVLGKTIGIGIVGLLQMILLVATALICAKLFLDEEILNSVLDMSNITPYLGIITVIYFILGYFAYALLYALTEKTVSKPEDIQSANGPVAILAVIGFYLSYFTMMNPTSELNVFASMFPISSPFCMPFRIIMGLASTTDVIISIAILLVTIFVIAKVAIKIYSNAILNYGSKISFKDMVRIYKDKNN